MNVKVVLIVLALIAWAPVASAGGSSPDAAPDVCEGDGCQQGTETDERGCRPYEIRDGFIRLDVGSCIRMILERLPPGLQPGQLPQSGDDIWP